MKEVNLKDLLNEGIDLEVFTTRFPATTELILIAMKKACQQTLELAAKNADFGDSFDPDLNRLNESILNTINQII